MEASTVFAVFLILTIGGAVALIYYYYHTRHKERVLLIEKGADAKLFNIEPRKKNYFFIVVLGIVCICIALGIMLGFGLEALMNDLGWMDKRGDNPGPYFVSLFLMLGSGFLFSYFLNKKINQG
ncbi:MULTISPECIES: DUF6249 domain-containing protein [Roseivirga]|jgi:ABC-type Fe3+ transport system permease subunit|uniref:DUF6249 domain-containing protein n=1 Tax=Roseivirga thermotolerans TaxID=1758176 RepID=A0ABQ3I0C7_9BACT|nr:MULTISPECIES: DUF6249 domain-containing protein [Roseivirga]MEC7752984.1 DUF6249 domain-containing protein [Bacteroidota bacterium]GHE52727.1 hypothetical protein GCM10011340_03850 [Roseivirga thermotolerans]|tara:strand:+ start:3999 stop:4370 length:372 start_codon:yes stop_codon:yes gene_type:complete